MVNLGHHNEFDKSKLTVTIQSKIDNKLAFYNHKADKTSNNKYDFEYKLKKIDDSQLPDT